MTDPTPQTDENVSPRTEAGRTFVRDWPNYPGFVDRILAIEAETRTEGHREGYMSRVQDEREASSPALDVERAIAAIDAMKVPGHEHLNPMGDWISVGVVRSILEGRHPILARLAHPDSDGANR